MGHFGGWFGYLSSPDEKPKVTRALLSRVFSYAVPYRQKIFGMLVMILLTTGLSLITPLLLRQLIDVTLPNGDIRSLLFITCALLFIPLAGGLISVFQRRLNAQVGEGVIFDLRVSLYEHLQRMSLRFFTNTKAGELMSRLNNDVIGAQNAINNTLVGIVTNLIQASAVLFVMLRLEWRLTLISVAIMPLFILTARRMGRRLRDIARKQMNLNAEMNAMINETLNIGGALLVKLFGRNDTEVQRFDDRASEVRDAGVQQAVISSQFFVIIGLVSAVGTALVYGIGGYFVIENLFTIGTIVAFGAYLGSLYSALQGLSNSPVAFATSVVSFERVFEVIDLPLEISEDPDPIQLAFVHGELTFEDVSFDYNKVETSSLSQVQRYGQMSNVTNVLSGSGSKNRPDRNSLLQAESQEPPRSVTEKSSPSLVNADTDLNSQARPVALEHINFKVEPGQLIALVGPSGSGKTTLSYLIPRLYDPTSGRILLDGIDLRRLSLESLSGAVGMVTQENHLFHDTIQANLLYAKPDATQADLDLATKAANIFHFITGLPDGYETIVGERGYRLSGGEKQRLALARVILKNPRILVLDEATSHLDSESESLIQEALKRVLVGRTSIVIAHRLSTILAADRILVLNRGEIAEAGTHQELLAANGFYAQLFYTQFKMGLEESNDLTV